MQEPDPSTSVDQNKIWYLKRSRLFDRASLETIEQCEHLFVQQMYGRGDVLFQQGDNARLVYLIKYGTVRIARRTADDKEITIAILGPGCLFGEEVVFSRVERTTIAVCVSQTLLCIARAEDLYGLITRYPLLAVSIATYLHEQRDDALAIVEDLAYLKVSDRLMRLFDRLAHEHGIPVADGRLIDVRLTHADIASLVGSTRETVSAQLAQLTREKAIRLEGRAIVVLTPDEKRAQPAT